MSKIVIIFNHFSKCSRCISASRGAVSPKKWGEKNLTRLSSPLSRSRRQNNHQSIQSPCAESPACVAERSTKRARCHNSCSLYWKTSSTKHDPLHSVHIQETSPCQEKQRLPAQTGFVSSAGRGRCPGPDKYILFLQTGWGGTGGKGFTGYDCRGWLPQIPIAQWCEAEVEQDMSRME